MTELTAVDVMGFAGSMGCGVDQAGFDIVAKREPAAFKGFGVESFTYNMPWVEAQVAEASAWDLPPVQVDYAYGCPPCSGFSQLSVMNVKIYESTGTTYRGIDAEINECMVWFTDYVARVRPRIAVMESVGAAYNLGRPWFESLHQRLVDATGLPYELTHVRMNAALVGGDVIRPRYFMVVHLDPFGVGLEYVSPRSLWDVIGDLDELADPTDMDWGHVTQGGGANRLAATIEWLESQGREWKPGTRLPENLTPEELACPADPLLVPAYWWKENPGKGSKREGFDGRVYSHWYSTDAFSPLRWHPERPFGVVVAATLDRAVHPYYPRNLTYREAARLMSLPDTWSMRVLTEKHKPAELGKAVPTASAKWISHWAKMSIEGTPGEYAGRYLAPGIRVINVTRPADVAEILKGHPDDEFWPESMTSDPSPSLWLVDRKARPLDWWQREDELGIFAGPAPKPRATRQTARVAPPQSGARAAQAGQKAPAAGIVRIGPDEFSRFLEAHGITKAQAAERLGVSGSRIHELTTNIRPKSWLNSARWEEVQARLLETP